MTEENTQEMIEYFFVEDNKQSQASTTNSTTSYQQKTSTNQEGQQELSLTEIRHQLVDLMPSYPALWNTSLRSYKDLNKKDAAWKEISSQLKNVTSK